MQTHLFFFPVDKVVVNILQLFFISVQSFVGKKWWAAQQCYHRTSTFWFDVTWPWACILYVCMSVWVYICRAPFALSSHFKERNHILSFVNKVVSLILTWDFCWGFSSSQSQRVLNVGAVPQHRACWHIFLMFWLEDQTVSQLLKGEKSSHALVCDCRNVTVVECNQVSWTQILHLNTNI